MKNISDRAKHQDIIDVVRGGLVLDIYLRSHERSASISFVEGSAAQEFMKHVKRNDIYVHGKRVKSLSYLQEMKQSSDSWGLARILVERKAVQSTGTCCKQDRHWCVNPDSILFSFRQSLGYE